MWIALVGCQRPADPVRPSVATPTLTDARAAFSRGDFARAMELAAQISASGAERIPVLSLAAEAAAKAGQTDLAVDRYLALATTQRDVQAPPLGLFYAAETCRDAGRLADAERLYRQFLFDAPNHTLSHERLAFLTSVSGRRWDSVPHYFALIRSGTAEVHELALFGDLDRAVEQRPFLEACSQKAPHDRLVQLGLAAHALWDGRSAEAESQLVALLAEAPDIIAGQAMLGELLVNRDDGRFAEWHARLPRIADENSDIWFVRGLRARHRGQLDVAARCFWEAVRLAPVNRRATYQLGLVLTALGHDAAPAFSARGAQLIALTEAIDNVLRSHAHVEPPLRKTAELLEQMGRLWEACGWSLAASRQFPSAPWTTALLTRCASRVTDDLPLVIAEADLARRYDLSGLPAFSETLDSPNRPAQISAGTVTAPSICFDEAANGPDFVYTNGADPATPGARQFEQTGGGVGVVDYDGDGWPDLYFPQGLNWPTGAAGPEPSTEIVDRLYRNIEGRAWADASQPAHLVDRGFGQGCAVGDFDNDGFPDVYIANIGHNQLLRNNGDGTFTDVTAASELDDQQWTVSAAIVDLNGDGAPDLFDVNYLTGPGVFDRVCQGKACSPSVFDGVPDQAWINQGDGRFLPLPHTDSDRTGKGLGVVAFDVFTRGRPCLFIANDQVPSDFLRNDPVENQFGVTLTNVALSAGLAVNEDGLAMAAMGIAADDINDDGRLDLFVTTFKDEANILYLQDAPGLFVDAAKTSGLGAPSLPFVGWGTQFLDADNDGNPDVVLANGNVDDYRDQGGDYHMRPQFFRNLGAGRFVELRGPAIGAFFDRPHLGRGLARLDWNGDGRVEFVVSQIGARAALLTNCSEAGNALSVVLHGRRAARDAIGTVVDIAAGQRHWRKQLTAGDGYEASNERMLPFGVGNLERIDRVRVEWPSGGTTVVESVPVNGQLVLVEDSPRGVWTSHRGAESRELPVHGE